MAKKPTSSPPAGPPAWLATYSDTVTLLMTFFVLLMTFSTTSPYRTMEREVSITGDQDGSGAAGEKSPGPARNAVIMKDYSLVRPQGENVPEAKPTHSAPAPDSAGEGFPVLDEIPVGDLSDSYALRVPASVLAEPDGALSSAGAALAAAIARNVRHLPYDLNLEVGSPDRLKAAYAVCRYLQEGQGILPGRLSVGVGGAQGDAVLFLFRRTR